jgi:hypothetical protein
VKKKHFSVERITAMLQQAEGRSPSATSAGRSGFLSKPNTAGKRSTETCRPVKPAR